jgi:hypothetical protein
MASAGRILIMPKGAYNEATTYEMLDMVYHNGISWLAKKTVVGIEPNEENSEYWHKVADLTKVAPKTVEGTIGEDGTVQFVFDTSSVEGDVQTVVYRGLQTDIANITGVVQDTTGVVVRGTAGTVVTALFDVIYR